MDDGLSLVESFSEAICNTQFVQETLQKSGFIVNCGKSVWEPQEVTTWLGITLHLRAKMFHISHTRIESMSNTLNNLTSTPYVTARKMAQLVKLFQRSFSWETLLDKKVGIFINLFWRKHLGIHISMYFITISL